jgi:hypothetical protein
LEKRVDFTTRKGVLSCTTTLYPAAGSEGRELFKIWKFKYSKIPQNEGRRENDGIILSFRTLYLHCT